MQRTIYLRIAYDGTEFHGWQRQPGLRTIQGVLEQSILRVVRHPCDLIASGRTDAGVHASGHVASFRTTCPLPESKFRHAIGSRLPEDVAVVELREVHPDFHATSDAVSKLYRYRIFHSTSRPVEHLVQRYVQHIWQPLDIEPMKRAARLFVGTKDFRAFAASGCVRSTTVRTVFRCDVQRRLDEILIDVEGGGFLYNQVRIMVGTLLNIGRGYWQPDRVQQILAGGDRANAGPTAPARGLCLRWVRYPPEKLRPISIAAAPDQASIPPCITRDRA